MATATKNHPIATSDVPFIGDPLYLGAATDGAPILINLGRDPHMLITDGKASGSAVSVARGLAWQASDHLGAKVTELVHELDGQNNAAIEGITEFTAALETIYQETTAEGFVPTPHIVILGNIRDLVVDASTQEIESLQTIIKYVLRSGRKFGLQLFLTDGIRARNSILSSDSLDRIGTNLTLHNEFGQTVIGNGLPHYAGGTTTEHLATVVSL